ncbi:NADPH:quinone reductase and related Zn-dependent oxidoreductase [Streptococcus suis]|nr:NADPH:quinone reductase and related Zn-dependent oxidoreductase [Streptococcus suis]CYZ21039.1 NADPH:quinone reductase and related Zn-dependent oxidoreductase [Streptococcus suis]
MKAAQHTSYNKNNITLNLADIAKPQTKPSPCQSDRSRR